MAGSETRIKTTTTTLRLSPEERAALEDAAAAAGVGPSSFARQVVMAAVGRSVSVRRRRDPIAAAVAPLLGELGRQGGLLNQLARYAHVGGRVDPDALAALRAEIERLTCAVMALREAA